MKKFLSLRGLLALVLAVAVICSALSTVAVAISAEADAFNAAVAELETKTEIPDIEAALTAADAALADYLSTAGNSKTDAAIAEKYASLVEIKNEMFIYYVDAASEAHDDGDYLTTRANLDLAEAILNTIENELTTSAMSYRGAYMGIIDELREPEENSASYVQRAHAAKNATTFAEAKKNYDSAKLIERNLSLDDYPGIDEARALLLEVQAYLAELTIEAADFLAAVESVYTSGSFFEGIEAAYEEYGKLSDTTITGVPEAKSSLDRMVSRHNEGADTANAMVNDMNSIIYGLILGEEKGTGNAFIDWVNKTFG